MTSPVFDQFHDILSTAAGNACRCDRWKVASTIAGIAPGATMWCPSSLDAQLPGVIDELQMQNITIRSDASAERTRDQPWGLTMAHAAIAETGSVILRERRLDDRSISLMTNNLIVLCPESALYPSLDDAARILREIAADGSSYATLVSGPSRTADIERQLTIGVQGPGSFHVIFYHDLP